MPNDYLISARVILDGVTILVSADSEDEAREKFESGDWQDEDFTSGEVVDFKLRSIEIDD